MKHLDLKQQFYFCDKYNICPNELLLLEILLIAQEDDDTDIVNEYFQSRIRGDTISSLAKLQESGIILKSYKIPKAGDHFQIYDVPINKNVVKDFFKCSFEMGKELFEEYPQFAIINGQTVGIRSVSKKFDSLEDFYISYGRQIRNKPDTHNHIMELVRWGKEHNLICTTLANFLVDQKWLELEALQQGDSGINLDAIKIV